MTIAQIGTQLSLAVEAPVPLLPAFWRSETQKKKFCF